MLALHTGDLCKPMKAIKEVLPLLGLVILVAASIVTFIVYFRDFLLPWKNRLRDKISERVRIGKQITFQRIVFLALLLLLIYILLLLIYLLQRI